MHLMELLLEFFGASGQSCIAGSRLYIQSDIYEVFLNKLIAKAEKIKLGAPMNKVYTDGSFK